MQQTMQESEKMSEEKESSDSDGEDCKVFVGVDGGGSTCRVSVVALSGGECVELATATGGPCNHNLSGLESAGCNVAECIQRALDSCAMSLKSVAGVCLTMSGCDRSEDKQMWAAFVHRKLEVSAEECVVEVYNDSIGVLASECPAEMRGLVVICGTGSIVLGCNGDVANCTRVGGWGPVLADSCGAVAIGSAALKGVCDELDKGVLATASLLRSAVMDHCGASHGGDVIGWVYGHSQTSWQRIGSLAPLVLQLYSECPLARAIVDDSIEHISRRVVLVIDRMALESALTSDRHFPVICHGSLFTKSAVYFRLFKKRLSWNLGSRCIQSDIRVVLPSQTAHFGAAAYMCQKSVPSSTE